MSDIDRDTLIRMAAFEHVRKLSEVYDHLTADELKPGFVFEGETHPACQSPAGNLQAATDAVSALHQDRLSAARRAGLVRRSAGRAPPDL